MSRFKQMLPSLAVMVLLLAVWWALVAATGSVIFPTPWQVVTGTLELIEDGTLWMHIGASLLRVAVGFLLAVAVAVPLGLWMGWVQGAFVTLNPLFQILRPISPIAWIPIAILWFGVGNASPIYLIFISSVFPMIVQTTVGVHTIEKRYLRAAENFDVSRARLFRQQRIEQREQDVAPLRRRHRPAKQSFVPSEHAQHADQGIQRIQSAAFQFGPRRDAAVGAFRQGAPIVTVWPQRARSCSSRFSRPTSGGSRTSSSPPCRRATPS